ncbi:UDP-galactopyranose mutase [Methylorubrum extorquens]|uniref:UDP-galactopyranose mutase n=1 Tax=Methylorubrum extorquens TaxID=408 RepID=A0A1S1P6N9_METEX|nr:UDP-galactopyranose mutase [Methylorubrum extorquens]
MSNVTVERGILVVGAGLAGAVHARQLADAGIRVRVIDRRSHIAGNAFDEVGSHGVRVHKYGPHLFHTANRKVLDYIQRFAEWVPYTHRVKAVLPSGVLVPLPINLDTINIVFGTKLANEEEARRHLTSIAAPIVRPANAAEYLASQIGLQLRDLFFRPYTKKMWSLDLEEMNADVVKRLPLRFDRNDSYFADTDTQVMPRDGYASFVASMLGHPLIEVSLNTSFDHAMLNDFDHCFASLAIDEFYGFCDGELPYRSIRFHHRTEQLPSDSGLWKEQADATFSVINFTDNGPFTRETSWARLPHHIHERTGYTTITKEEPCDYRDNDYERYYPVKTADGVNEEIYTRYKRRSEADSNRITFIGRCGTYRYLDMDQVINQSLMGVQRWLAARGVQSR